MYEYNSSVNSSNNFMVTKVTKTTSKSYENGELVYEETSETTEYSYPNSPPYITFGSTT